MRQICFSDSPGFPLFRARGYEQRGGNKIQHCGAPRGDSFRRRRIACVHHLLCRKADEIKNNSAENGGKRLSWINFSEVATRDSRANKVAQLGVDRLSVALQNTAGSGRKQI